MPVAIFPLRCGRPWALASTDPALTHSSDTNRVHMDRSCFSIMLFETKSNSWSNKSPKVFRSSFLNPKASITSKQPFVRALRGFTTASRDDYSRSCNFFKCPGLSKFSNHPPLQAAMMSQSLLPIS